MKKEDTEQKGSHSNENKSNIKDNIKADNGKNNAVQKHYIKNSNGKTDNRKMDNSKMDDNQKANTNVKKTRRRSSPPKTIPKLDLNGNTVLNLDDIVWGSLLTTFEFSNIVCAIS